MLNVTDFIQCVNHLQEIKVKSNGNGNLVCLFMLHVAEANQVRQEPGEGLTGSR